MGDRNGDEEALVRAAIDGDTAAFTALVERYQQRIGGYLYRLVGDWETAEDLTQETFMRAHRALPTARVVGAFRAWLFRIATNLARDHLRRRRRIRWLPLDSDRMEFAGDPFSSVEEADAVRRVLARLSAEDRAVLLLCAGEDLSYNEAGVALVVTANTARMRYTRAKERFRALYRELTGGATW